MLERTVSSLTVCLADTEASPRTAAMPFSDTESKLGRTLLIGEPASLVACREANQTSLVGVAFALVVSKPLNILANAWVTVRAGWCRLPADVSLGAVWLIGFLAGFTKSIFIAILAFADPGLADGGEARCPARSRLC
jgi:hypothetical protein